MTPRAANEALTVVRLRIIGAPHSLLWRASTDPAPLARWWGPPDVSNPICDIDLPPDGAWRAVLQHANGNRFAVSGRYRKLPPTARLVSTEVFEAIPDAGSLVTPNERGGPTTLRSYLRDQAPEHRDRDLQSGMEGGMPEINDRLEKPLAALRPASSQRRKEHAMHATNSATADREVILSRTLDAPRTLVWHVWTDPAHLPHWWGPRGFTLTMHEMDVRPGGRARFILHGPDGADYDNRIDYLELTPPERIVYRHGHDRDDDPTAFLVTVTFADRAGATELTMRTVFPTVEQRDATIAFGAIELGHQTLDRLAERLAALREAMDHRSNRVDPRDTLRFTLPSDTEIEIQRAFAAPRTLVFEVHTRCEHLAHWLGPRQLTMASCEIDFRPGGHYRYVQRGADGAEYAFRGEFREIVPPERIVQTFEYEAMPGVVSIETMTLEERNGLTYLTARSVYPSREARDALLANGGMEHGIRDSYERLDALLGTIR